MGFQLINSPPSPSLSDARRVFRKERGHFGIESSLIIIEYNANNYDVFDF